jgi:hypothetical protein
MRERAYKLMKEWCDSLLSYQVRTKTPYTDGGLLCPACHVIHGRIADLCFPLTVIWSKEGDEKYLEEADKLIDWSEYNLKTHDGLWYNDITNRWYATSAFSAMSMGEAIYHFGDTLPEKYKAKWMAIFMRMCDVFMTLDKRESFKPVTNYYCGIAALLAMAWRLTEDVKYYEKSKYWVGVALERFDGEGLLYGEGYPLEIDKGCRPMDMGYDLEESLPLLLRYASLTGDYVEFFRDRFFDHLEFLLPDGAIDDSFGIRHNKWTYWGSRTSDGIIEGLALLLDDPICADACERALTLYEKCTREGLLAMPMADVTGEPTCLHHTFTHAKALAALVCAENCPENIEKTALPCEKKYGVKSYQKGNLLLVSSGCFRATFSSVCSSYHPAFTANGGGSMNLLYHDSYGIICAATSAEYNPTEPLNQQYLRNSDNPPCMTAQFFVDGKQACQDKSAKISYNGATVTSEAEKWRAVYSFEGESLKIGLSSIGGIYSLPIVCAKGQKASLSEDKKTLSIAGSVTIESSDPMDIDTDKRIFNQVGGLAYLPISIPVNGHVNIVIK